MSTSLFTSESVSMGHPDKMCDQISDAVLDAVLDANSQTPLKDRRVACETLVTTGVVVLAGEVRTQAAMEYAPVARSVVRDINYKRECSQNHEHSQDCYVNAQPGFGADSCAVMAAIGEQSQDIAQGVDAGKDKEQGAGDQGMMFGYACRETDALMPAPVFFAHRLMEQHRKFFKSSEISYLRPDAKSQVTFEYDGQGNPQRIDAVVLSTQHDGNISLPEIEKDVKEKIILPVLSNWTDEGTRYHINPTGKFVEGGPHADAGLTGRKIIVDTYGGMGRHGGGAFSGKDPSKVDRSAAYAARWVAKNLVAAGLASRCEVQIAYAIGKAEPVSVRVDSFGTSQPGDEKLAKLVRDCFDLTPRGIIEELGLLQRGGWRYRDTACYGHFGREGFPWEATGKADELRRKAGS